MDAVSPLLAASGHAGLSPGQAVTLRPAIGCKSEAPLPELP